MVETLIRRERVELMVIKQEGSEELSANINNKLIYRHNAAQPMESRDLPLRKTQEVNNLLAFRSSFFDLCPSFFVLLSSFFENRSLFFVGTRRVLVVRARSGWVAVGRPARSHLPDRTRT